MAKCGSSKRALLHSAPQSDSQLFSLWRKGGAQGTSDDPHARRHQTDILTQSTNEAGASRSYP